MKKIITTFSFIAVTLVAAAQCPVSFHAKAGIGTSQLHGKHSSSESLIAYKAGIGAEYALNKTWVVQSALEFVSIGGKDAIGEVSNAKMKELYLQIPLMLAARLHLGKNYHASLSAGPYAALGVGGKTSGEMYSYESHTGNDYRFSIDTFGSMIDGKAGNHRFDAGIAIGLTLEYKRFIFGAEAQVGLVRINEQINQVMGYSQRGYFPKNFASFFTLGYRFY